MKELAAALAAGLIAGGITAGVLAYFEGKDLASRGTLLAASLQDRGDALRTYFYAQQSTIQAELTSHAQTLATQVARSTAEEYIGTTYGLTADRIRKLGALYHRWAA